MFKKNVKFRKQIAGNIGVGFKLPEAISTSLVPNEPQRAIEEVNQIPA
jgi:hypothetical protein